MEHYGIYDVCIALAKEDSYKEIPWVNNIAIDVNLNNQKELIKDLSEIIKFFRIKNGWIGASSNNIKWSGSRYPLKVIHVPHPLKDNYITIINPEIRLGKEKIYSLESCAALPNRKFGVKRSKDVHVKGNVLEEDFNLISLDYFLNIKYRKENVLYANLKTRPFIIQHEIDHLEGILISDKGIEV